MIDIHNHILYGLDDGSKSIEESILMIKEYINQGVTKIIATSHYRRDIFDYDLDKMHENYKKLKEEIEKEGLEIEVYLGHEAYLDERLLKDLKSGKCQTMAGSKYVLVEIPRIDYFDIVEDALFDIECSGYIPIIAHCERLVESKVDIEKLEFLKNKGYYLQINAEVLLEGTKHYLKKWIYKSLKDGTISFVASDAHNLNRRKINLGEARELLIKKIGERMTNKVLIDNQEKIILDNIID